MHLRLTKIATAMHAKTIAAIVPAVSSLLRKLDIRSDTPNDILAGQLVYGISATLHSPAFEELEPEEKKNCLMAYMNKII